MTSTKGKTDGAARETVERIDCSCEQWVARVLNAVVQQGTPDLAGNVFRLVGYEIAPDNPGCLVTLHFDQVKNEE
jgi:hypothetical protein